MGIASGARPDPPRFLMPLLPVLVLASLSLSLEASPTFEGPGSGSSDTTTGDGAAGGSWRGPGDTVPPGGGLGGSSPTAMPGGARNPSQGTTSPTPGAAAPTGGTSLGAGIAGGGPTAPTLAMEVDDGWWLWWEYNKTEFLRPNGLAFWRVAAT